MLWNCERRKTFFQELYGSRSLIWIEVFLGILLVVWGVTAVVGWMFSFATLLWMSWLRPTELVLPLLANMGAIFSFSCSMIEILKPWDPEIVTIKSEERKYPDEDRYVTYCEAVMHGIAAPVFAVFTNKYSHDDEQLKTRKSKRLLSIPHILAIFIQSFFLFGIYVAIE